MQAGAVLLARLVQDAAGVPVATRLNDVRFRRMVRPGDTIEIDVQLKERLASAYFLHARVNCEGKLAARLDFACTLAEVTG
jgi:3-hydroxyacyl-[acyl-carrier-protein] dehydratase